MADRPYSRVYWSVMDDEKFDGIREDVRHFGTWTILLIVADMAHPAAAFLPGTVPKASIRALAACGLIDLLSGGRYRVHGLASERGQRSDSARNAAAQRWHSGRNAEPMLAKTSIDEQRQDEQVDAHDPWNDAEGEAVTWLAKHGCALGPHSGYYRHVVTMVEAHGIHAVIGMFDRLASAGTKQGDVKGYVFGARDALDAQTRPSLTEVAKADRDENRDRAHRAELERTQAYLRELRGEPA